MQNFFYCSNAILSELFTYSLLYIKNTNFISMDRITATSQNDSNILS